MKLFYDLHVHSALSPCGDNDNTPNNIVNMAKLKGLDVIAVADHNSVANLPAVLRLGEEAELVVVPGMELTTAEDIHLLCLFPSLAAARDFGGLVEARRMKIPNREAVFGEQLILNERDEIVGKEPNLLIAASNIPLFEARDLVLERGGAPVPAHLDKHANSAYYTLGKVTPDMGFRAVELTPKCPPDLAKKLVFSDTNLPVFRAIVNSDAHYLWDISEAGHVLEAESRSVSGVIASLLAK